MLGEVTTASSSTAGTISSAATVATGRATGAADTATTAYATTTATTAAVLISDVAACLHLLHPPPGTLFRTSVPSGGDTPG